MMVKKLYVSPECEEDLALRAYMLCASDPDFGGSEGVDYEDWVIS